MGEQLLQIENLTIGDSKAKNPIIENLKLKVGKKQIVGIVGESGCGKSMTSLGVMRLLPPNIQIQSGNILFQGKELTELKEREMRKLRGKELSMIFQEPIRALHPLHKVGKQIEESLKIHTGMTKEERKAKTIQLMEAVGIPKADLRYNQYPHQLSGGLNQRVMIAMAIAVNPLLLIADEPTTALDVTIQAQILKLLRSLREQMDISIILVSHDLAVICENCDHVYVMYCGQIVEEAEVSTFFEAPKHPYTKALIQASPDPEYKAEELASIPGTVPSIDEIPKGCRFAERCPLKQEQCERECPDLYRQKDGASVRCFLYKCEEEK